MLVCYRRYLTNFYDVHYRVDHSVHGALYETATPNALCCDTAVGVLHLNSLEFKSVPDAKKKCVKKKFTPFFNLYPQIWIKTDKIKNTFDQYVVVKLKLSQNELTGTVLKYIGAVSLETEAALINEMAACFRSKKIDKIYGSSVSATDLTPNRINLCGTCELTVSVDPKGSVDIDDAIGIKQLSDDRFVVHVHIADPTSYIVENSPLDSELSKRAESVYLETSTLHMLPVELTEMISLKQGHQSRSFTVSLVVELTNNFTTIDIVDVQINKTLINVDMNVTYEYADVAFADHKMYMIGKLLFEKYVLKKTAVCYNSKKMIETFMLLANHFVAKLMIDKNSSQLLVRVQKPQTADNLCSASDRLYELRRQILSNEATLKLYHDEHDIHSSLGCVYTHFTSPIRRYSDMIVHRQLYNSICSKNVFELTNVDLNLLFNLNHLKKFYKKIYEYERKIKIIRSLFGTNDCAQNNQNINLRGTILATETKPNGTLLRVTTDEVIDDINETAVNILTGMIFSIKTQNKIDSKLFESIEFKICILPRDIQKIRAYL